MQLISRSVNHIAHLQKINRAHLQYIDKAHLQYINKAQTLIHTQSVTGAEDSHLDASSSLCTSGVTR